MKKLMFRLIALMMVAAMTLSMCVTISATDKTTWIKVSIEDDEGGPNGQTYRVFHWDESSHYLTKKTPLLIEVVSIINKMYSPFDRSTRLWDFDSKAMKEIMDEGLQAYAKGEAAWQAYVDKYYIDVNPVAGMRTLKSILRDRSSVLGDLEPNVAHKISFKNEVETDSKYGVTYIVTVTRYEEWNEEDDEDMEVDPDDPGSGGSGGTIPGDPDPEGTTPGGNTPGGNTPGGSTPGGPTPELNISGDHMSYVIGYPDGTVRPTGTITRAEVATIFFRLLTDESRDYYWSQENSFSDVAATDWFNNAVSTMAAAGIINGYPNGTFGPQNPVTRAEFAAIATRFTEQGRDGVSQTYFKGYFRDVDQSDWYSVAVELAYELGWAQGYEGNYRPEDNMSRAEVMTMINRILERDVKEHDMLKDMIVWPDNTPELWYYEAVQEATNSHTYRRTEEQVPNLTFYYEKWLQLLENPDWAALERSWSDARVNGN